VNAKPLYEKIFFVSLWLVIGGGLITLLAAAMHKQKIMNACKIITIKIKGAGNDSFFINENEITDLLYQSTGREIKGMALSSFDLP
jgi:hypothetical protein